MIVQGEALLMAFCQRWVCNKGMHLDDWAIA